MKRFFRPAFASRGLHASTQFIELATLEICLQPPQAGVGLGQTLCVISYLIGCGNVVQ